MSWPGGTGVWRTLAECETAAMPVLEPEPQDGQKKLLLIFAVIFGIMLVIGVVASFAAP